MASHPNACAASIVVPTRMRPGYLEVALASIAPQLEGVEAELIVVDDGGPSEQTREIAERYGARYEPHDRALGLNIARNTGVERSEGELVVFVDDDVEVSEGWLGALLLAAEEHPEVEVFTGPILPRLEGAPPHTCGREAPPITSLDLGPQDVPASYAWGANMTIRRAALERVGPFDVSLCDGGDEQEWQERLADNPSHSRTGAGSGIGAGSGTDTGTRTVIGDCPNGHGPPTPVLYVAGAKLHHRRDPDDARLRSLCKAAFTRGKAARRFDARRGQAPSLRTELRTLAGCAGHIVRRRCPAGLVMVAHSSGRTVEAIREPLSARARRGNIQANPNTSPHPERSDDFLSGESGTVGGLDGMLRAACDLGVDGLELVSGRRMRLVKAANLEPPTRRVLALGIERPEHQKLAQGIRAELSRSRHDVEIRFAAPGDGGKFENLNLLLEAHDADDRDWLLVVDDDIELPHTFLDRFLLLTERFGFDLAQPAHRRASHAAWQVTRKQPGCLARETRFVEIGPVTAFARSTFSTLLPFPSLRMGWGLDLHWAALARERAWRSGVIDAVAIRHRAAPAASAYSREQAMAEARAFLADRPYLRADEAQRTLTTYKRL